MPASAAGNVVATSVTHVTTWLDTPFQVPLDPWEILMIVGIVIVGIIVWNIILFHIRIAAQEVL